MVIRPMCYTQEILIPKINLGGIKKVITLVNMDVIIATHLLVVVEGKELIL